MRTVWLVRHGNRQDFVDRSWRETAERPHDPPLSADGVQQARETGRFLANEPVDHLFASPFLRAVETAACITESLHLPINIEHGICELLREDWFPVRPDYLPVAVLAARFPLVNAAYRSLVVPAYPEESLLARAAQTIDRLTRQYPGNLLLVCHGAPVEGIARALAPDGPTPHINLCCIVKLVERAGVWTMEADGSDISHLSQVHNYENSGRKGVA